MSDFFSGVYGARFPDLVMNSGPLPPTGGLPAPLHDTADARINYNSTLLGDLNPYAYGEPGYQSSQVSYVNHPHRIYKLVPPVRLPEPQVNANLTFELSHGVDDSDIAFVMRLDRGSTVCSALGSRAMAHARNRTGTTLDGFINLATLNYILAGLQLCYTPGTPSAWFNLLHDLDKLRFSDHSHVLGFDDVVHIVRNLIRPFGVVRGSEKQGGQDEVGLAPATWPVSFVCTMVIDGKERNIVNMWHYHDIHAGDDLVLRLKPMPIPRGREVYTLNHYYKGFARKSFEGFFQDELQDRLPTHVWQLVPDIFSLDIEHENDDRALDDGARTAIVMPDGLEIPPDFVWQEWGYWHIGRTQVMFRKYAEREYYNNDMANQLKLNHMDMTFAPTWLTVPGRRYHHWQADRPMALRGGAVRYEAPDPNQGVDRTKLRKYLPKNIRAEAPAPDRAAPRLSAEAPWAPSLHLERFRPAAAAENPVGRPRDEGVGDLLWPRVRADPAAREAWEAREAWAPPPRVAAEAWAPPPPRAAVAAPALDLAGGEEAMQLSEAPEPMQLSGGPQPARAAEPAGLGEMLAQAAGGKRRKKGPA